jgi:plasmid maintenance system antidote protein VapI
MTDAQYNPDWIPPPGATIKDLIARKNPRQLWSAIADHLGEAHAEMLLDGRAAIDSEVAALLASSVGLSVAFWLERERLYRAALVQRQCETELLGELPLNEMRERAVISSARSHAETVAGVLDFFGAEAAQTCSEHIQQLPALLRQKSSRTIASRRGSLAAWVRAGELEAKRIDCSSWDPARLQEMVPELRRLTRVEDPQRYLPTLMQMFHNCGVAFVVLRPFDGCRARGVVAFPSCMKAMMLLSYRHLSDDQFWFTMFHEVAHLLFHSEDGTIVDDWDDSVTGKEVQADRFAADTLIPPEYHRELEGLRGDRSIVRFARQLGVSRGIVVGQMQYRGVVGYEDYNHLKVYYRWTSGNNVERR